MLKSKHTNGPWEVRPTQETLNGGDFQARIIATRALSDRNDAIIIGHYTDKNGPGNIHWPPNAYLIAAAPDLLNALTDIVEQFDKIGGFEGLTDLQDSINILGRKAIQKASVPKLPDLPETK